MYVYLREGRRYVVGANCMRLIPMFIFVSRVASFSGLYVFIYDAIVVRVVPSIFKPIIDVCMYTNFFVRANEYVYRVTNVGIVDWINNCLVVVMESLVH